MTAGALMTKYVSEECTALSLAAAARDTLHARTHSACARWGTLRTDVRMRRCVDVPYLRQLRARALAMTEADLELRAAKWVFERARALSN